MTWRSVGLVLALAVAAPAVFIPRVAVARSDRRVGYEPAKVWATAVRFIRVDLKLEVTDKDLAAGYVMFELREDGKVFPGSIEIVADGSSARVVLNIEDRPTYVETSMLDKLERKLRAELGTAAPPSA